MTFDEAIHEPCDKCGDTLAKHRLTREGLSYCLVLNKAGAARRAHQERNGFPWPTWWVRKVPVKWLMPSSIDVKVGEIVNEGLGVYLRTAGDAT